jgi:signal peptidase I
MVGTKDQVNQANFLLRYSLQSFGIVVLLAVLIRAFLVSSYVMSGTAMLPSIWPGDFLIAGKWGLRHLHRGEIVALRCPPTRDKICLKRVVGLPGDRIEFRDGLLVLNGQESRQHPVGPLVVESVLGVRWTVWPADKGMAPMAPVVVPPQTVFLLNDKREDLEDSRIWGPVEQAMIEGKAKWVWMSLDWFDGENVRSWPRVRWARLLHSID